MINNTIQKDKHSYTLREQNKEKVRKLKCQYIKCCQWRQFYIKILKFISIILLSINYLFLD